MHIVFEHQGVLPVQRYGGTERFLFWLMKELARLGHKVTLLGNPESSGVRKYGIELIPIASGTQWEDQLPEGADLLHLFATPPQGKDLPIPVMVTIEGNGQPGEVFHPNSVFVSRKHAQNHSSEVFVHNGIDLEEYPFQPAMELPVWDEFLFLAKAKWKVKNLSDCIRACKRTSKRLHVAGGRRLNFSRKISYYGMVDQKRKLELLARTRALLFPVRWHEPFGIAVIEAMAAGLPVIATPFGSLPEIIAEPEVGVICSNYDEFEHALREMPGRFRPSRIRDYVYENFRMEVIARRYLTLYECVLNGESLNPEPPRTIDGFIAQELLPF